MNDFVYFDTSALAKWYVNESKSNDVEAYIQRHGPVAISDLTFVEMRCLLAQQRAQGRKSQRRCRSPRVGHFSGRRCARRI